MHSKFLEQTLHIAYDAVKKGNHPFGALLVHDGKILFTAENEVNTRHDVTAHAELLLVQKAQELERDVLGECVLYTSTEPCAMCSGAIYWSGIRKVVYGCSNAQLAEIAGNSLTISSREIFGKGEEDTQVWDFPEESFIKIHRDFW